MKGFLCAQMAGAPEARKAPPTGFVQSCSLLCRFPPLSKREVEVMLELQKGPELLSEPVGSLGPLGHPIESCWDPKGTAEVGSDPFFLQKCAPSSREDLLTPCGCRAEVQ